MAESVDLGKLAGPLGAEPIVSKRLKYLLVANGAERGQIDRKLLRAETSCQLESLEGVEASGPNSMGGKALLAVDVNCWAKQRPESRPSVFCKMF